MISLKMFNFIDSIYLNTGFLFTQVLGAFTLHWKGYHSDVLSIKRIFTNHLGTRNHPIEIWDLNQRHKVNLSKIDVNQKHKKINMKFRYTIINNCIF